MPGCPEVWVQDKNVQFLVFVLFVLFLGCHVVGMLSIFPYFCRFGGLFEALGKFKVSIKATELKKK